MPKYCILMLTGLMLSCASICAQDTITVMNYNILNFPNPSNTDPDGNDASRVADFSDIIEEADADIILVEELKSAAGADLLLAGLNINGNGKTFAKAPQYFQYANFGNMLFYNTAMASFIEQIEIPFTNSAVSSGGNTVFAARKKSYYELEVFSPSNVNDKDTLHLIACHFKSGSADNTSSSMDIPDRERRSLDVLDVIHFINNQTSINANLQVDDNIILGGDLNFYSHLAVNPNVQYSEPAYDSLVQNTNYPIQFIDQLGPWTRNSSVPLYECMYTQSTTTSFNQFGNNGISGGLDDRFDFILMNDNVDVGTNKIKYIPNSYEAFGSSKNLNSSVISGSSPVKTQLYHMSDHLPVVAKFTFTGSTACSFANMSVSNERCVGDDFLFDVHFTPSNGSGAYEIVDITNGNTVLASGTSSPISVTLTNQSVANPFDILVQDMTLPNCMSPSMTVNPLACGTICSIAITSLTSTCLSSGNYDLEVCFEYNNPISSDVNIIVEGINYGPFPYPTISGDCIIISASTLNVLGDGSLNVLVEVEDIATNTGAVSPPFMSELHYNNNSVDIGEFVEISSFAMADLSLYELVAYDTDGKVDDTQTLSGMIGDDGLGCGAIAFTVNDIGSQYFENDTEGIALVEISTQTVIEFLSRQGTIIADNGPAMGMTSIDIGVAENSSTPLGASLKKEDTAWVVALDDSPGLFNTGLTSCGTNGLSCVAMSFFDEPDCSSFCPVDIVENGTPLVNGTYQVSNHVISSGTVPVGGNVIFDAGVSIELNAGFCVPMGSAFLGTIGGCQ